MSVLGARALGRGRDLPRLGDRRRFVRLVSTHDAPLDVGPGDDVVEEQPEDGPDGDAGAADGPNDVGEPVDPEQGPVVRQALEAWEYDS